tara:strand:- start:179 stop:433 length:255 start_codon:yes stop_codon:yes gene_type:complete
MSKNMKISRRFSECKYCGARIKFDPIKNPYGLDGLPHSCTGYLESKQVTTLKPTDIDPEDLKRYEQQANVTRKKSKIKPYYKAI